MIDFKVGDYVMRLRNPSDRGTVTKIVNQYWDDGPEVFDTQEIHRLPDNYEVQWEDGSITQESQFTIDPCPFEPNELLKKNL